MKYVKFLLKKIFLYKKLKQVYHKLLHITEIRKFKKYCDKQKKLKIIIGASETKYEGWISTNEILLNLINEKTFNKILKKDSVDNFLAEHYHGLTILSAFSPDYH